MLVEQHPNHAVINFGSGKNAVNDRFVADLHAALDRACELESEGVRAVVLRGGGKFFSNGLDLPWLGAQPPSGMKKFLSSVFELCARIMTFRLYTVAALNGHAFGAGAFFALCCDYRVMHQSRGFFCLPEVHLGMRLTDQYAAIAKTKLPVQALRTVVLFARRLGAAEALRLGVVDETAADPAAAAAEAVHVLAPRPVDHDNLVTVKHELYGECVSVLRAPAGEPKIPSSL